MRSKENKKKKEPEAEEFNEQIEEMATFIDDKAESTIQTTVEVGQMTAGNNYEVGTLQRN